MPLWERLPILKVPLRPDDKDVPLDLQALVEQCYRNGAYFYSEYFDLPKLTGICNKDWRQMQAGRQVYVVSPIVRRTSS